MYQSVQTIMCVGYIFKLNIGTYPKSKKLNIIQNSLIQRLTAQKQCIKLKV